MFAKIFALLAMVAVAFAAPNPKPQFLTYTTGLDYAYPGVVPPVHAYGGPFAYSSYSALPAVAAPYYVR